MDDVTSACLKNGVAVGCSTGDLDTATGWPPIAYSIMQSIASASRFWTALKL